MGKPYKIVLALAAFCAAALLLVAVMLFAIVDPDDFGRDIERAIGKHTGRSVHIEGDFRLALFPSLGIDTGRLGIANAPPFGDTPFLEASEAHIRLKLLPLLSRRLEVDGIRVKGLALNLEVDASGRSNWSDLAAAPGKTDRSGGAAPKAPRKAPKEPSAVPETPELPTLPAIAIENGHITWDDRKRGRRFEVQDLRFTVDPVTRGAPADVELDFTLAGQDPRHGARFGLNATLTVDKNGAAGRMDDLRLTALPVGVADGRAGVEAQLIASIALDLGRQTLSVSPLRLKAGPVTVSGELSGERIIDAPILKGPVTVETFNPRDLMATLDVTAPQTADPGALTRFAARFDLLASKTGVALDRLAVDLDGSHGVGRAAMSRVDNRTFAVDLSIDSLDVDRYRPAPDKKPDTPKTGGKKGGRKRQAAAESGTLFPLERLRALDAAGTVKVRDLKLKGLKLHHARLDVHAENGLIHTRQTVADLYQGTYAGAVTLDARGREPALKVDEHLTDVRLGPLLTDLKGKAAMTGTATIGVRLSATGNTAQALKKHLDGHVAARFRDGSVQGVNLSKVIGDVDKILGPRGRAAPRQHDRIPYSTISLTARISNGVITNEDLRAESPALRLSGKGAVNLASERIKYTLVARMLEPPIGVPAAAAIRGIPVAIKVRGTLDEPRYRLSVEDTLLEQPKAVLEEKKDDLMEKLDKKLGRGTRKLLEQFF